MDEADAATIGRSGSSPKGVARRKEILDRAIEVFQERGAYGTSLRKIAEAIGVSHAALMHYFDSREQLLVAVYAQAEADRHRPDGEPPGVQGMINAAHTNVSVPGLVQLYTTLLAASLEVDNEIGKEFFSARFDRLRVALELRFRAQQEAGEIRADVDPAHIAALLIAASDGLQVQWLLEPSIDLAATLQTFGELLRPPTCE